MASSSSLISSFLPNPLLPRRFPSNPPRLRFRPRFSPRSETSTAIPPLPDRQIIVGVGGVTVDYLATVAEFPNPDDKIRSTSLKVQGGGNAGNALTCAARLGLKPRLISKVANDAQGKSLLSELEIDGVDPSYVVVSKEGNSPFTYVIVDNQTNSRTCIHTPGYPPMVPTDLPRSSLLSALDGASLVYFDVRLHETALVVAQEATQRKIPILVDAERKRDGLDDLLNLASYVVCTEKFPQAWTEASSIPSALVSMLVRLPNIRFVIVTLGDNGCLMLERSEVIEGTLETNIDSFAKTLSSNVDNDCIFPTCITSQSGLRFTADGIGVVNGKLYLGTAEKIPSSELIDTTGAGDAFIGAVLYGICAGMPPEKMLPFASKVAAAGCRALGARTGLPLRADPCLVPFF